MNVEYCKKMENCPLNTLVFVSNHYSQEFPISLILIKNACPILQNLVTILFIPQLCLTENAALTSGQVACDIKS